MIKVSTSSGRPGFDSRLRCGDFPGRVLPTTVKIGTQIGTPLATLPGVWRSRVSAGTGEPGVSISQ